MDSRGVERVRDEFWVSSWGQQVMLNQSCTIPTLLWCFLGRAGPSCAVPCRARPVEGNGASSGEFRLAESNGQLQVFLLLLGEPGESLLFLSLALALCPLYHVFLGWILLHENRGKKETYAHNGCSFETLKTHQQQTFFLQSGHFDWFVITIYVPETKDSESGRTIVGAKKKNHVLESKFVALCPFWERCIAMRSKRNPDFCRPPKQITKKEERTGKAIEIDFPLSKWKQSSLQHIYPCKVPAATWSGQKQGLRC